MNTVLDAGPDELTVSMVEVDAAAARAALAPQLALVGSIWITRRWSRCSRRWWPPGGAPPTSSGGSGILARAGQVAPPVGLFGDSADSRPSPPGDVGWVR